LGPENMAINIYPEAYEFTTNAKRTMIFSSLNAAMKV
jgi:hypothetical protein